MIYDLKEAEFLAEFSESLSEITKKTRGVTKELQKLREIILDRAQDKLDTIKKFEKEHQDD
tara:strand:+ start:273 stop:455 length:183 start_codon:yes stop_codon:yes gene_type:complete